jgi:hypothetical protein
MRSAGRGAGLPTVLLVTSGTLLAGVGLLVAADRLINRPDQELGVTSRVASGGNVAHRGGVP